MFETHLFNAMQKAGRGSFSSSFTNLLYKHRALFDVYVETQMLYVLDVTTSKEFKITYSEVDGKTSISLIGPHINYYITDLDFNSNICSLRSDDRFLNPRFEYFDGLLSVIDAGIVVLIIPFQGGTK